MGAPEMAPKPPQRSSPPGKAGVLLDLPLLLGPRHGPQRSDRPGEARDGPR